MLGLADRLFRVLVLRNHSQLQTVSDITEVVVAVVVVGAMLGLGTWLVSLWSSLS